MASHGEFHGEPASERQLSLGPPLAGVGVVVCRAAGDAGPLIEGLRALGARPVLVPLLVRVAPADGGAALEAAVVRLAEAEYRWLAATSANGARAVAEVLAARGARVPPLTRVAAVGPATAAAFADAGITVDLVAPVATAADLAAAFPSPSPSVSVRVLAPLAELASDDLVAGLVAKGYAVDRVGAYRTTEPAPVAGEADRVARAQVVVLTSPSVVERFVARFGPAAVPPVVVCIGPRTAARAVELGLPAPVVAEPHTIEGVVDALGRLSLNPLEGVR